MGGLVLLPGEREVLRLHPSPLGWLGRYGIALLPAVWAGILWTAFHSPGWTAPERSFRSIVVGSQFAAHLWSIGGLALGGWMLAVVRRSRAVFRLALAIGLLATLLVLLARAPEREALPLAVATASLPLLAWAEGVRWSRTHHITTLRLVSRTTFPRRSEQAERHAELADIDLLQGPLGRLADVGTLQPVAAPPAPASTLRLVGVPRVRRVARLVQVLVRQATATDYLREQQGLDREQAEALAALQRR